MNSLIFGISLSAILSSLSFLVVLLRVSPLSAPTYALPSFFMTFFLMVCSVSTLIYIGIWHFVPHHSWDTGKLTSISLREGIFTGLGLCILLFFLLFQLATWWICLLVAAVFVSIELALPH